MEPKEKGKYKATEDTFRLLLRTRNEVMEKAHERRNKIECIQVLLQKHYARRFVSRSEAIIYLIDGFTIHNPTN